MFDFNTGDIYYAVAMYYCWPTTLLTIICTREMDTGFNFFLFYTSLVKKYYRN